MSEEEDYQDDGDQYGQTYDNSAGDKHISDNISKKSKSKRGEYETVKTQKEEDSDENYEDIDLITSKPSHIKTYSPIEAAESEFKSFFDEICKKEGEFSRTLEIIKRLDNFIMLNKRLLALAAYFHTIYSKEANFVNQSNIIAFIKNNISEKNEEKLNNIIIDFIRYVRLYEAAIKLRKI